jgi:hydrogenase nickel incorporation protein HypA/HybF
MHEVGIAQGMMKIIENEAAKHGVSRVSKVHVRVGELSNVVPDALSFAFDSVILGTVAEGAELEMDIVPAKGRCDGCGIEFDMDKINIFCPQCDEMAAIVSGKELEITEIEAE